MLREVFLKSWGLRGLLREVPCRYLRRPAIIHDGQGSFWSFMSFLWIPKARLAEVVSLSETHRPARHAGLDSD